MVYGLLGKDAHFNFDEQFEEILAWCAAHRGGLQALPAPEDGQFEMPMLSALQGGTSDHEEDCECHRRDKALEGF
jgi:hypothetical protein